MSKMRVMQITKAKGPFELVEREIPEPAAGRVRIKVEACGICHSDSLTKEGVILVRRVSQRYLSVSGPSAGVSHEQASEVMSFLASIT